MEAWPEPRAGAHAIALLGALAGAPRLDLTLVHDDFERALAALALAAPGSIDAVFLDGFAPAKNPGAWSPAVFEALGRAVRAGGTAATWSIAGVARRGLAAAGFVVTRVPGHGPKRERIEAVRAQPQRST
ncbi:MAG: MnmC family methyltransferase [Planctomycetota bacterium]